MQRPDRTPAHFNTNQEGTLPALLGIETVSISEGQIELRLTIAPHHLAPNGYLHAGTVVTLADTAAGYGTVAHLPEGANGFTTIELKTNFLGTSLKGDLVARASLVHGGRMTQIWDVEVFADAMKKIAVFRCTQMILRKPT